MDPTRAQIALFRKFAHLYDSGVSLAESLDLARGELPDEIHDVVGEVLDDLYRGTSLADAMAARSHCFAPEIVALVRAGELRGELSAAARSAADGLEGGVLEGGAPDPAAGEALLLAAGDARFLHVRGDVLFVRARGGLRALGERARPGAVAALAERAGAAGAFVWEDRLVRLSIAGGHVALELSGVPGPEPEGARPWRERGRGVLVLHGDRRADFDAAIRSVLRAFDPAAMRVAVGLPAPEAVAAPDVATAIRLDPDVVALRDPTPERVGVLVAAGVPAVIAAVDPAPFDGFDVARAAIG